MFGYWEKVDKKQCLELIRKTKQLIGYYQKCHSFVLNKIVPGRINSAINGLMYSIEKSESFYAWYTEVKAVCEALDTLNKLKMENDPIETAKAFGKLFVALAAIGAHLPGSQVYTMALQRIGENFAGIAKTILPSAHGSEGLDDDYKAFLQGKPGFTNGR